MKLTNNQLTNSPINQQFVVLSCKSCQNTPLHLSRTLYKSNLFMQNKANLQNDKMNVTAYLTKSSENFMLFGSRKNKANQSQNKANFQHANMNVTPLLKNYYENLQLYRCSENKPNSKPIQTQFWNSLRLQKQQNLHFWPKNKDYTQNLPQRFPKKPVFFNISIIKLKIVAKNSIIQKTFSFPIYKVMEIDTTEQPKTKLCPFCAEVIQAKAVKCRFCSEILSPDRIKTFEKALAAERKTGGKGENILFEGRPSLWAMTGSCVKSFIVLALAYFLIKYPLENLPLFTQADTESPAAFETYSNYEAGNYASAENGSAAEYDTSADTPATEITKNSSSPFYVIKLTENQIAAIAKYRVLLGTGLFIIVPLVLLIKVLKLKMMHYEVTPERVEFSRGILDRKVDNIDMFRIIDLKMRRSLLDCIVGVGTVGLITTDKTDPQFTFEKVHNSRRLYDVIKKASLEADIKTNVVHLE